MLIELEKNDRVSVYGMANGSRLAVPHAPTNEEAHHPRKVISEALAALADLDAARRAIGDDPTLSDIGKAEKLKPLREQVAAKIAKASADIGEFGKSLSAFEAKTYATPELDPSDAVSALHDWELRDGLKALDASDKAAGYAAIAANPRLMIAVLRAPMAMQPFTDIARQIWTAHVEVTNPDAAKVAAFKVAHDWAAGILPHLEQHTR